MQRIAMIQLQQHQQVSEFPFSTGRHNNSSRHGGDHHHTHHHSHHQHVMYDSGISGGANSNSGSNRSRSESGSSTESSKGSRESNSSNGGSSTGGGGSSKSRRRSHRPRGCRGGSNRRKHILQQQQQQQQQMMIQQQEHQQRLSNESFKKQPTTKSLQPLPDYHTLQQQHQYCGQGYGHAPTLGTYGRTECSYAHTSNASFRRVNGDDYTSRYSENHHRRNEQNQQAQTVPSVLRHTYNSGGSYYGGVDFSLRQPYYHVPANATCHIRYSNNRDQNAKDDDGCLGERAIQRSYSDTSSASGAGSSIDKQKDYLYGDDASLFPAPSIVDTNTNSSKGGALLLSNENLGVGQILPPLPSDVFEKHRPIPSGPNPYALKLSSGLKTATAIIDAVGNVPDEGRVLQPRQSNLSLKIETIADDETASHTPFSINKGNHRTSHASNINKALDDKGHHRAAAEQIRKQSKMVEGGSLFVTSPRSFLMGVRTANSLPASFSSSSSWMMAPTSVTDSSTNCVSGTGSVAAFA
jgi:hypothetical protein